MTLRHFLNSLMWCKILFSTNIKKLWALKGCWYILLSCSRVWQMLLDEGVDTGVRDSEGLSPAMWACRSDRIEHFDLLSSYEHEQTATRQHRDCHDGVDDAGYERDLCGRTWLHWSVRRVEPLECLKVCQHICPFAHFVLSNDIIGGFCRFLKISLPICLFTAIYYRCLKLYCPRFFFGLIFQEYKQPIGSICLWYWGTWIMMEQGPWVYSALVRSLGVGSPSEAGVS